jgi:SNF2 family DNA or RNA helicase
MKLPTRTETNIMCPLSKMQRFWYKRLLLKESDLLVGSAGSSSSGAAAPGAFAAGTESLKRMRSLLMQLRKCCNHPYLFDGAEQAMLAAHAQGRVEGEPAPSEAQMIALASGKCEGPFFISFLFDLFCLLIYSVVCSYTFVCSSLSSKSLIAYSSS